MKKFSYIIEHMEPEITGWPEIEYKNMINNVGGDHLILSHLSTTSSVLNCIQTKESVSDWPLEKQQKVLLLDPKAEKELCPQDAQDYEYLLFGGILGDDPPQDRTSILRDLGFATRHLGPVQMTTDTAVLVAQLVLEKQIPLADLKFVDHPEIKLGKKSTVQLPFRYLLDEANNPKLPPGLIQHLKKTNDEPLI